MQRRGSSFLKTGIIFALFYISGNIPVEKQRFRSLQRGVEKFFDEDFSSFVGMLFGPVDFFELKVFIVLSISSFEVGVRKMVSLFEFLRVSLKE